MNARRIIARATQPVTVQVTTWTWDSTLKKQVMKPCEINFEATVNVPVYMTVLESDIPVLQLMGVRVSFPPKEEAPKRKK